MFELGGDDNAIMVASVAWPNTDKLVALRIDEGDAASKTLESAKHADHIFSVIGDSESLHVGANTLDLLLDRPGFGIDDHDAA